MFLKHAQCITEVATPMCLILVKTLDDNGTDKLFHIIFWEIYQNIKPSFLFVFKFQEFFDRTPLFVLAKYWYGQNLGKW